MSDKYSPTRVNDEGRTVTQVVSTGEARKLPKKVRKPLEGSPANAAYAAAYQRCREWDEKYYHPPDWRDTDRDPAYGSGIGGTVNKNTDGSAYVAPSQRVCIQCGYPLKGNKVRNGGEHAPGCYVFNSPAEYGNPWCKTEEGDLVSA
jgi:hypothetical protein